AGSRCRSPRHAGAATTLLERHRRPRSKSRACGTRHRAGGRDGIRSLWSRQVLSVRLSHDGRALAFVTARATELRARARSCCERSVGTANLVRNPGCRLAPSGWVPLSTNIAHAHEPAGASALGRLLKIFAPVKRSEALTVALLALNCFILLTCYYVLKVV